MIHSVGAVRDIYERAREFLERPPAGNGTADEPKAVARRSHATEDAYQWEQARALIDGIDREVARLSQPGAQVRPFSHELVDFMIANDVKVSNKPFLEWLQGRPQDGAVEDLGPNAMRAALTAVKRALEARYP